MSLNNPRDCSCKKNKGQDIKAQGPAKVFLTGATGYIGGSVLSVLLQYPDKYTISALVRNPEDAEKLKKLGVTPVIGALEDVDLLTKWAKDSDAVVNTAQTDHLPSTQAFVKGLTAKGDNRAVYVQTSGTAIVTYPGAASEPPFDDLDMPRIHAIPATALHKDINTWIYDNVDNITAAIIAPATVNGIGTGPFRKLSSQVPNLAKAAVERKKAGWAGKRKDVVWGNVNVLDLAELYRLVLDGLLSNTIDSGKEGGWYFGTTAEHEWGKVAELLGKTLYKLKLVPTPEVSEFEKAYVDKHLWGETFRVLWEVDSRCVANRSRKIGWNPTHPDIYQTLEEEIKYMVDNGELKP